MKIFIDTANIEHIREANDLGIIDGVTTNPTLVAREGKEFIPLMTCAIFGGYVLFQTLKLSGEYMLK